MARFEVAILDDKLITRATRDVMWTPGKPSDGMKIGYALGWGNEDQHGVAAVGHTGGQQGTSTAFLVAPAGRAGVVVLTNMEGANAHDLAADILSVLLGKNATAK
jgi:CubicO group peptidase (beta-lactamase class C family)